MAFFRHFLVVGLVTITACTAKNTSIGGDTDLGAGNGGADMSAHFVDPILGDMMPGLLTIAPLDQTMTVTAGQPLPSIQYTALAGTVGVQPIWTIDRGEIGAVDVSSGLFVPLGTSGGVAHITAHYGLQTASTSITVTLTTAQNGDPAAAVDGGASSINGAGGYGGVGGNGPGGTVTPTQQQILSGVTTADSTVKILYPYDQTVWPRGLLAPLLQWNSGAHSFDSVYVHISEANYDYKGFFSAPNAQPFVNLPIPQSVWQDATYSNAGENMVVTLVFAQGPAAYGPYTINWKIVPAVLGGTVYYNSYGTALAKNLGNFGGATLAIKPGMTAPSLVAGSNGGAAQCRVCHSVSANGSQLLTQHGDNYDQGSLYALTNGNQEAVIPDTAQTAFASLTPDGTMALTNVGASGTGDSSTHLLAVPSGAQLAPTGLPANFAAASPSFSGDGKHVAFNFYGGAGSDQTSLAIMDFDSGSLAFSNFTTLVTPAFPALWPSFMPTNNAIVYELETATDAGGEFGVTRKGTRGELWWIDLATKTPVRLDNLNGLGYLPAPTTTMNITCTADSESVGGIDAAHTLDAQYNYEPTVNPISSGGYAWIVFTSRRIYGNVGALPPFCSDPRGVDLTTTNITPKKLWVAAIDLNAPPGTDPSHPAFYLPAQELHAGNSRGYWAVDPCHQDGASCLAGDECCGGYCQESDGGLVCNSSAPTCSQVNDHCDTTADCCGAGGGISCINNLCAVTNPPIK